MRLVRERIWNADDSNSIDVFCAGNDETVRFLEGVLDYVCELFPSKVVHIGGDECPRKRWKECPKCQARMKSEGMKDVDCANATRLSMLYQSDEVASAAADCARRQLRPAGVRSAADKVGCIGDGPAPMKPVVAVLQPLPTAFAKATAR